MADYFVKASGSDAASGLAWNTAKATLTGALAAATASGDRILIKYDDQFILSAATTFTAAVSIIFTLGIQLLQHHVQEKRMSLLVIAAKLHLLVPELL